MYSKWTLALVYKPRFHIWALRVLQKRTDQMLRWALTLSFIINSDFIKSHSEITVTYNNHHIQDLFLYCIHVSLILLRNVDSGHAAFNHKSALTSNVWKMNHCTVNVINAMAHGSGRASESVVKTGFEQCVLKIIKGILWDRRWLRPLSTFFPKHADFFTEMHF